MLTTSPKPHAASGETPALTDAKPIRNAAVRALLQELITYPKPGLVSLVDTGSHADMDATSFIRSTLALRRYFEDAARAGGEGASFATLRQLGLRAEARMLRATRGVNTHRGAVFNLGLLAAAAGARRRACAGAPMPTLGETVKRTWGDAIARHRRDAMSHGSLVSARHGAGGAQAEAAAGFPSVYRIGLPAYRAVLSHGGSVNQARIQAFFELLARLDDTNLLHRGGPDGLAYARGLADVFLGEGGVFQARWRERTADVHRAFCARRLSPGGSADLLAACLFVHAFEA
jgi:triphosphoribosyl-dephospho-CoA synthase